MSRASHNGDGGLIEVVPLRGGPPGALVLNLKIECPECGAYEVLIAGHHLRAIIRELQAYLVDE